MPCSKCAAESPETASVSGTWVLCRIPISLTLAVLAIVGFIAFATRDSCAREDPPLVQLALAKFHTLTHAERSMLEFAQAGNVGRGDFLEFAQGNYGFGNENRDVPGGFAVAGSNSNPEDPSNDPAHADEWSKDREVRARLL